MEDCRGDKRYANRLMRIYFGRVELIVARKTGGCSEKPAKKKD